MLGTEDRWPAEGTVAGVTGRQLLDARHPRTPVGWWLLAGAVATVSVAVGALLLLREDSGGPAAPEAPATAATTRAVEPTDRLPAAPTTSAPPATTLPPAPTTAAPPSTAPAPPYVGLVHGLGDVGLPEDVVWYGGALLTDDAATAWVRTPLGSMFWLERAAGLDAAGRVDAWEVVDSVVFPPLEQDVSDVVFLGSEECRVGDRPEVLVGIFPNQGTEWLTSPHAAWVVDLRSLRLVAVSDAATCRDPGFGA